MLKLIYKTALIPRYYFFIILIFIPLFSHAQDVEDEEPFAPTNYIVPKGDTLYSIAQEFDLGVDELLLTNPNIINSRSKFVYAGRKIILPTTHLLPDVKPEGIVINLAELRIYFFVDGEESVSFTISIGKDEVTPIGKTKIIAKHENPSWIPPASIREEDPELLKLFCPVRIIR